MKWHFWLHPLRGIAALGVVFLHCYWTWGLYDASVVRKLYLMVDFFFVLSGFVISSGYAKRIADRGGLGYFLKQRFKRLSFHYYLSGMAWILAALAAGTFHSTSIFAGKIVNYAFFMDVFSMKEVDRVNPVAWSVMAEFWVYIAFALVTLLIRPVWLRIAVTFAVALGGTVLLSSDWTSLNLLYGAGAILRAVCGFSLGAFCWLTLYGSRRTFVCGAGIALLGLLAAIVTIRGGNHDILAIPLSSLVLIVFSGLDAPSNPRWSRALRWIGDASYPLYMWHFLIAVIAAKVLKRFVGGGQAVIFHGESFVLVPPYAGWIACIALVACSLGWVAVMMRVEAVVMAAIAGKRPARQQA